MAGIGQKWSFLGATRKGRLQIRKQSLGQGISNRRLGLIAVMVGVTAVCGVGVESVWFVRVWCCPARYAGAIHRWGGTLVLGTLRDVLVASIVLAALGVMPARGEILIATAGPMSGSYLAIGEQFRWGAEQAVADINTRGGVLGELVRLVVGDDACDSEQAVAVAQKLVTDGAVFIAGHYCSGSSIPASKVYEDAGVLMISPGSTNPRFTDEGGSSVFRVCGRDDVQGAVAGAHLAERWGDKRIAILQDGGTYG